MSDGVRRAIPATILAAAIVVLVALYATGHHAAFAWAMRHWLIMFDMPPFDDARGLLGAIECERLGIETYLANPCDPQARHFVYTPTWKLLTALPITRDWTIPFVAASTVAFLVALWGLPPARGRRGLALAIAATLSPSTVMAIEYGNNEMLIFSLAVLGAILAMGAWRARAASYGIFLALGFLKYFPFTLLALALREKLSRLVIVSAATALSLLAFILLAGDQLRLSLASIPSMSAMTYVFGIRNLSELMVDSGVSGAGPTIVRVLLTVVVVGSGIAFSRRRAVREAAGSLDERYRTFLIVGGILTVTAYILGQNVAYRQIHMLMVLPALIVIARRKEADRRWRALPWIAVGLMYEFLLRMSARAPFDPDSTGFAAAMLAGFFIREAAWLVQATMVLALVIAVFPPVPALEKLGFARKET